MGNVFVASNPTLHFSLAKYITLGNASPTDPTDLDLLRGKKKAKKRALIV